MRTRMKYMNDNEQTVRTVYTVQCLKRRSERDKNLRSF